jgi:hypothetical protein
VARNRVLVGLGLAAVAVTSALLVVLATWDRGDSGSRAQAEQRDPITATATLDPRIVLFGDTITAQVDVVVDRTVIDPDQVTVTSTFTPWTQVAKPVRSRRDAGGTTYLRTTFVLRCLTTPCVPVRPTEEVDFEPARVGYAASVGDGARRLSVDVPWPRLVVHTRVAESTDSRRDVLGAPWRADFVSLPLVSYRVSPGLLLALLLAGGILLVLVAASVGYRAIPERVPPPEPEPPPVPVASLLEQALALLEAPAATDGAEDRRRALELVADEVDRWGDVDLAHTARALAWSEDAPGGDATRAFAAQLRSRMESSNGVPV